MKLNFWRIGAKAAFVAVLCGVMNAFEQLAHPVLSAQAAIGQLADTAESSAQMTAYGWIIPVGWAVISIITFVFAATEVRATVRANNKKEDDVR